MLHRLILLSSIILCSAVSVSAQTAINSLSYNPTTTQLEFDNDNGNTAVIAQGYVYKFYVNLLAAKTYPVVCTGTTKPWKCKTTTYQYELGSNNITVTATIGAIESPKSNSLLVFYAVNQKEIITNTNNVTDTNNVTNTNTISIIRCTPGSFKVGRFTSVTQFTTALNGESAAVVSFFATANAIYFIACIPIQEQQ